MRRCIQSQEGEAGRSRATQPLRHTRYLQELLRVCGRVEEGEIRRSRRRNGSGEWPVCRSSPAAVAATAAAVAAPVLNISLLSSPSSCLGHVTQTTLKRGQPKLKNTPAISPSLRKKSMSAAACTQRGNVSRSASHTSHTLTDACLKLSFTTCIYWKSQRIIMNERFCARKKCRRKVIVPPGRLTKERCGRC